MLILFWKNVFLWTNFRYKGLQNQKRDFERAQFWNISHKNPIGKTWNQTGEMQSQKTERLIETVQISSESNT